MYVGASSHGFSSNVTMIGGNYIGMAGDYCVIKKKYYIEIVTPKEALTVKEWNIIAKNR